MANLTFADTHNMVTYLSKSDASVENLISLCTFLTAWLGTWIALYTSLALTQKVFAIMHKVGKGFSKVETPLFATMLVQPQPQAVEKEDDVKVTYAPTPPSPSPPPQDPITTPLQAQPAAPSSPPQTQPTNTSESSITLLNTLMETWRIDDVSGAATKDVNAVEPIVFDDEEVTMTMAQTLIKMKAKKARLLDEQIAKRLNDEEVEQAAAKEKQEKDDLEKAKVQQKQYEEKQENINWNTIAEKIQEKHLDNIMKHKSLKRKLISMIIYLKNISRYKMKHFRGMTYDKLKSQVLILHKIPPTYDPKEMSEEDVQNMLEIVLISKLKVEALQVKYPLIDCEIHFEGSRSYWKIVRVVGITKAYHCFEDTLKGFDREDLDALWRLVKEKFSTTMPTVDKEKVLWVELTRLNKKM
nr:hypothetical protein [Tanacetum cinerariifolium]